VGTRLKQDSPFWTSSQLRVLHPFKEEWFLASSEDKKYILQRALKELAAVTPEADEDKLKSKVVNWFKQRVKSRTKWGPAGKVPSLRTIVYWYKGDYFTKLVEERYPPAPGETRSTKPNVGAMSAVAAEYMRQLEMDPAMAEEKQKYEKLRLDWAKNGAPRGKRQKCVQKMTSPRANFDFGAIGWLLKKHRA
jgi:hypothetical protein